MSLGHPLYVTPPSVGAGGTSMASFQPSADQTGLTGSVFLNMFGIVLHNDNADWTVTSVSTLTLARAGGPHRYLVSASMRMGLSALGGPDGINAAVDVNAVSVLFPTAYFANTAIGENHTPAVTNFPISISNGQTFRLQMQSMGNTYAFGAAPSYATLVRADP